METSPLLCRKQICEIYGINRSTLYRWESRGLRLPGGRISREGLNDWLERDELRRRSIRPLIPQAA